MTHGIDTLLAAFCILLSGLVATGTHAGIQSLHRDLDSAAAGAAGGAVDRLAPALDLNMGLPVLDGWMGALSLSVRGGSRPQGVPVAITVQGTGAMQEWPRDLLSVHFETNLRTLVSP